MAAAFRTSPRIRCGLAACLSLAVPALQAQSWTLGPFHRLSQTAVITPDPAATFRDPIIGQLVHWEYAHTFNPAATVQNGKVVLLYRAEDDSGQQAIGGHASRLGLAESADGIHFHQLPEPVFYAAKDSQQAREFPGGTEDPRLVETENGLFVLTYTQWNRKQYTVGIATSRDLRHWTKYGPAFDQADGGRYRDFSYKSAGILTQLRDGRLVAVKLHGHYWMYWGEIEVRLATSTDLIHWTPVPGPDGQPLVLLSRRPRQFDSGFPEVGPPPVLTPAGIVVFYNAKNAAQSRDPALAAGAYSAGQALFSSADPKHLLGRMDHPWLQPKLPFEQTGQYAAGTVFTEGLVYFDGKWMVYYGAADSRVGIAAWRPTGKGSMR